MKVVATELEGVVRIEPTVRHDDRGYFLETWSEQRYADAGLPTRFVQDNLSQSVRGTLRGLHFQHPFDQGKLVSVPVGEVFDVAVDLRVGSPTFGRWVGARLSSDNKHQLYVPPGFAHGFCVTSDHALVAYKCTEFYHPEAEVVLSWDDSTIGIEWPVAQPMLSERDRTAPKLAAIAKDRLPLFGQR
jgi:dTDP-4-dehydrorhamnose 3,5-epimerase